MILVSIDHCLIEVVLVTIDHCLECQPEGFLGLEYLAGTFLDKSHL